MAKTQAQAPAAPGELLAGCGVRATHQRVQVLEELAREANDATAYQLFERLRSRGEGIGLATVYRTLSLLSEQGVIDALTHRGGELCYRLCSAAHHHHLTCSECHRVVELDGCNLGDWVSTAAAAHGFTATEHQVEVVGVCSDCRAA